MDVFFASDAALSESRDTKPRVMLGLPTRLHPCNPPTKATRPRAVNLASSARPPSRYSRSSLFSMTSAKKPAKQLLVGLVEIDAALLAQRAKGREAARVAPPAVAGCGAGSGRGFATVPEALGDPPEGPWTRLSLHSVRVYENEVTMGTRRSTNRSWSTPFTTLGR